MMFRSRKRSKGRKRHRVWVATLAVLGLVLGSAAAVPVLTGRTESPKFSLDAARHAVDAAREADAARWAPDSLGQAESAFRAAMLEQRRQELRFFFLRNFSKSRAGLRLAEEKAKAAQLEAESARREAHDDAVATLAEADEVVGRADAFGDSLHRAYSRRRMLRRSRIALDEAHLLLRAGEPLRARERADAAMRDAALLQSAAVSMASRYLDAGNVRMWRRWHADAVSWSKSTGGKAIVVIKDSHRLHLYDNGRRIKTYRAELGFNIFETKLRAGDGATPEGRYRIIAKKGAGSSTYYKALLLDYPNEQDRARLAKARKEGRVSRGASPGSLIEIHGEGGQGKDWTRGCVALSNRDMDDLFGRVGNGTPVTILGSDGEGGLFTDLVRDHHERTAEEASEPVR
jgi:lipoprotein-anchoring transpeptidase ErfK/SrfK